jgi:hypothetical protein
MSSWLGKASVKGLKERVKPPKLTIVEDYFQRIDEIFLVHIQEWEAPKARHAVLLNSLLTTRFVSSHFYLHHNSFLLASLWWRFWEDCGVSMRRRLVCLLACITLSFILHDWACCRCCSVRANMYLCHHPLAFFIVEWTGAWKFVGATW